MWQQVISIDGPYDFDALLQKHYFDPLKRMDRKKRSLKIPIIVENKPNVVEVAAAGTTDSPTFHITCYHDADQAATVKRLSEMFQWDFSLQTVYDHFQATNLKEIFTEFYGSPLVTDYDPFGCLAKCIIFQQLNIAFAGTLIDRFIKSFGEQMDGVWFYPTPERVANLTVEQLRNLQFSTRKAEYVIGLAQAVVQGELDLEECKHLPDGEIFQKLIKIRGIGPWTIENFLLFGLGRPNLFPMADIGLQNALKQLYDLEQKPTIEQMEKYKQPWEPFQSYASLYLWRSIES